MKLNHHEKIVKLALGIVLALSVLTSSFALVHANQAGHNGGTSRHNAARLDSPGAISTRSINSATNFPNVLSANVEPASGSQTIPNALDQQPLGSGVMTNIAPTVHVDPSNDPASGGNGGVGSDISGGVITRNEALGESRNHGLVPIGNLVSNKQYPHVLCGTLSVNKTDLLITNPNYPEPIYTKSICETVIKRADPKITKLTIRFRLLQLYRPTYNGQCFHDRFAVFTDLNALLTPVICGDNSGKEITIPFPNQTNVILSVATSDLDHDRYWYIEIEQEK